MSAALLEVEATKEQEMDRRFRQYQPLCHKLAHKFKRKYPKLGAQDIVDEAQSLLANIVARWDIEGDAYKYKGTCSELTWIYRALYWDLDTYCGRRQPRYTTFTALSKPGERPVEDAVAGKVGWLEGVLRDLGEDARVLVETVVMAPAEIAEDVTPRKHGRARVAVRGWLKAQGWSAARIDAAWAEVGVAL